MQEEATVADEDQERMLLQRINNPDAADLRPLPPPQLNLPINETEQLSRPTS